ncbi:MAG TPA: sulfite exporter TauE/SafE family protein [Plasticicumulans sp.]|nr:sulfite exporter TauE/SafE family protein [Plasticicumulans sp.]
MPILHTDFLLPALALGVALGWLGGLFGIGGGLIAIPVLGLACGLDQLHAQGTALVMVLPNVVIGFWRYRARHGIAWRPALLLGLTAIAGSEFAAHLATGLPAVTLRLMFAGFLIVLAGWLLRGLRRAPPATAPACTSACR